jgi:hypothetical protein
LLAKDHSKLTEIDPLNEFISSYKEVPARSACGGMTMSLQGNQGISEIIGTATQEGNDDQVEP